jgi:hypothetical protein
MKMEVATKTNLPDVFKALYTEFVNYMNKTGLSNRVLTVIDGKPIIDFQFTIQSMGGFEGALKQLSSLPSYRELVSLTAQIQNVEEEEVEKTKYGLFCYIFSEVANCVTPPQISYHFPNAKDLSTFDLNEQKLSHAILNAVCADDCIERTNKYLLIFENLNISSSIKINDNIKLIRLSKVEINAKLKGRYDPDSQWSRVFSAFEINEEFLNNKELIPVLSTLLRLYKKGDIRFKSIYQAANHIIRGEIYVNHKSAYSEADYYENAPANRSDAWRQYSITETEIEDFSGFIGKNLTTMLSMSHSCKMYNMVFSSPLHLRIPLLFFVIESFFSDINSEVVFRIALYLTVLLKEDEAFRKQIKDLYHVRSCIAHGDLTGAQKKIKSMKLGGFTVATEKVDTILNKLWKALLDNNWTPKESANLMSTLLLSQVENT